MRFPFSVILWRQCKLGLLAEFADKAVKPKTARRVIYFTIKNISSLKKIE